MKSTVLPERKESLLSSSSTLFLCEIRVYWSPDPVRSLGCGLTLSSGEHISPSTADGTLEGKGRGESAALTCSSAERMGEKEKARGSKKDRAVRSRPGKWIHLERPCELIG